MATEAAAAASKAGGAVTIDALTEKDLPEAARIIRVAFGSFFGAPGPENFWTDRDYAFGRHAAPHVAAFGATLDGQLVGSNFATKWGSVAFFGPLSVRPDLQERGIARALLARTMAQFDAWGTRHAGLFTFAQSAKHVALYQKFGFYARFLTAIMAAPARRAATSDWSRFSVMTKPQQEETVRACREVAETVYPGLDLSAEIKTTQALGLGDTLVVEGAGGISAFAICQYGPRSEASAGMCLVKFGAVRNGSSAEPRFSTADRGLRNAGGRRRHAERAGRHEYGAARSISASGRTRLSHRNPRCCHAPAQRCRLQPAQHLRRRRLAVVRPWCRRQR